MQLSKLLVTPPDIGIPGKLSHRAAMLLPLAVIEMVVVTHETSALSNKRQPPRGTVEALASAGPKKGCQGRNACG